MGLRVDSNKQEAIKYDGMRDVARKIYQNEGIPGFYKGLTPNLVKIFPSSGIFFLSYELTMAYLRSKAAGSSVAAD